MALRSALRNAVGRSGGTKQAGSRSHQRLSCVSRTFPMLLPPAPTSPPPSSSVLLKDLQHDDSEAQPSISGRHSGVQSTLIATSESPDFRQWFQCDRAIAGLDHRGHRRVFWGPEPQLPPFAVMSSTPPAPVIRIGKWASLHWWSQVRKISSSNWVSFPRKMERYSGREIDRDPSMAYRQARFDENFKRLPVVKLPQAEYRQKTVDKSTKNIALVPKKWKRALLNKEVVDAVIYLKRAKRNSDAVKQVMRKRIARLLKLELMLVLLELQRLDEWLLARQVFNAVRKESWYKPNLYLYQTMVQTFGKNKQIKEALQMFEELQAEGLEPDESIKRELLRAYVICDMIPPAVELYKEIQKSGLDKAARSISGPAVELYKEIQKSGLDRAARSILFHGLNEEQKLELAAYEKKLEYDWS